MGVRSALPIDSMGPDGRPLAGACVGTAGSGMDDDDDDDGFDAFDDDDDDGGGEGGSGDEIDGHAAAGEQGDNKRRRGSGAAASASAFDAGAAAAANNDHDYYALKPPKREPAVAREKNREHAKNTRMRKKNYIEALKVRIFCPFFRLFCPSVCFCFSAFFLPNPNL